MCGIAGFTWQDPDALGRMARAIAHRGPDDRGTHIAPGISLAHQRLSIIDLSPGGHQPMHSADGRYTIVYNGELYNFKDIKKELEARGEKFVTASDTEVLLRAFMVWGEACLPRLNGIFAFAVWDAQEHKLSLVRDHLGVKPLSYTLQPNGLVFASEAKALFAHPLSRELNRNAANLFFRMLYVPGPQTMWQGVQKLPAGSVAHFQKGKLDIKKFWQPTEGTPYASPAEACADIRLLAGQAVRDQLVSDVPLGVFLSGGIDSSAILGLMRETMGSANINTFSIGFQADLEQEKYNADFHLAARTAAHFGTTHHPITVSGEEAAAVFEKTIWHMDDPVSNPIQPITYLLAQHARQKVTVALGGDGGDELFGGYDRYWYAHRLGLIPNALRPLIAAGLIGFGKTASAEKVCTSDATARYLSFLAQKENIVRSILSPDLFDATTAHAIFAPFFSPSWNDPVNQMMAADAKTWLVDESLTRSDRLTMAHALEQRVPLLDWRLAESAFRIPSAWKLDSRALGKKIFRDALADVIPPFLINQPKRGFFSPASKWLRSDLLPLARELLSPTYNKETADLLQFPVLHQMLEDHVAMRGYHLPTLWSAMTFQAWARAFLTHPTPEPGRDANLLG